MHIALDGDVCLISLFFLCIVQTAVVEEGVGTNKFAESSNHGISFYLRLELLGK